MYQRQEEIQLQRVQIWTLDDIITETDLFTVNLDLTLRGSEPRLM